MDDGFCDHAERMVKLMAMAADQLEAAHARIAALEGALNDALAQPGANAYERAAAGDHQIDLILAKEQP